MAVVPQLATYFTDTRLEVAARSATLFAMAPEVDVSAQAEAWSQAANRVFEATMETAVTPPDVRTFAATAGRVQVPPAVAPKWEALKRVVSDLPGATAQRMNVKRLTLAVALAQSDAARPACRG